MKGFPRLCLFKGFGKRVLTFNSDIAAPCRVLLLFGTCSVTVLNSFAREAHRLIFILRGDGKK